MDFEFSRELEGFRGELRDFVGAELPPNWTGVEEDDVETAQGIRRKIASRGWLTMAWPTEYGGQEAPHFKQMVFNEEMAYNRVPAADNSITMLAPILMLEGTEEQKQEFLPRIARAEMRWAQGYSEPGSGSDLASLQTRAVEDGDDFVINGTKIWTSGAHHADWIFMMARTDPDAPKHRGISFFLADMTSPGLTIRPIVNMAGIHGFNQLFFDDVRVPKRYLVGEYNRGWYVGARLLDFERSGIQRSAGGRRILEELVQFAKEANRDGQSLAARPEIRNQLADMAIEVEVSRMISYRIGHLQSTGEAFNKEASIGKAFGSEMQQRLYRVGMDLLGLYGMLYKGSKWSPLESRIQRGYLSSFSSTIAAGTSEIQRNVIAGRGLGLPRG